MGKKWDKALPDIQIFKECLRILKNGHFAFIMCIPRSDLQARMIMLLEKAGFRTDFSPIYWAFASGFPKSGNLSKLADKRDGTFKEREVVKPNPTARPNSHGKILPSGFKHHTSNENITKPASEDAKRLDGMYTPGLKPAVEIILVAMKSLNRPSYLDQALDNEGGGFHLDDARIPTFENLAMQPSTNSPHGMKHVKYGNTGSWGSDYKEERPFWHQNEQGRFPANLLVSNDVLDEPGKISKSGGKKGSFYFSEKSNFTSKKESMTHSDSGGFSRYFDIDAWFEKNIRKYMPSTFPFLIVPKPSQTEKNTGLDKSMIQKSQRPSGSLWNEGEFATGVSSVLGQWESKQANPHYGKGGFKRPTGEPKRQVAPQANFHPTVKSIRLFSYLTVLGLGKKKKDYSQTVLDPFLGSGTAGLAALLLGKKFIGCELNPDYLEIAKARIKALQRYRDLNLEPQTKASKLNQWF